MPKCTDAAIAKAVQLKKAGATNKNIAAALSIREETFSRWIHQPKSEKQTQLGQALKKAEADYEAALLSIIAKAGQERDWKAAAWLLERKYPETYARQEKRVYEGANTKEAPTIVLGVDVKAME